MRDRILVIEDANGSNQLLQKKLAKKGCTVFAAHNEQEFWKYAKGSQVDMVVMDVCLKSRLGPDVYQTLLDFHRTRNIPVIFETGLAEASKPVEALHDENYVFFPEPINFDSLYAEIKKLLNERQNASVA